MCVVQDGHEIQRVGPLLVLFRISVVIEPMASPSLHTVSPLIADFLSPEETGANRHSLLVWELFLVNKIMGFRATHEESQQALQQLESF